MWAFSAELPAKFTLDLSYSGNHAVHLMDQRQVNALPAGHLRHQPEPVQSVNYYNNALLPYLGWGNLNAIETLAYSRYNAMMFRLSRRFANNLSVNFNYTRSTIMDIVDNDSDAINNPFNIRQNWAPAGYDQPNVVTLDFVYDASRRSTGSNNAVKQVVNGWEVSGMFRSQSGMPITSPPTDQPVGVDAGAASIPTSSATPMPGRTASSGSIRQPSPGPPDGQYGTLGRNALRLPGVRNVDASLIKNFAHHGNREIARSARRFQPVQPSAESGASTTASPVIIRAAGISATVQNFGQANSYRDARTLQLALRFSF